MENKHFTDVKLNFKSLIGKKIKEIESIRAEYGRTYNSYLLITCEDGERIIIHGGDVYEPNIPLETMREVDFFKPEEIASKVKWEEVERRREKERQKERKKRELERLKKELGEE